VRAERANKAEFLDKLWEHLCGIAEQCEQAQLMMATHDGNVPTDVQRGQRVA
jgi:hypothetical protein